MKRILYILFFSVISTCCCIAQKRYTILEFKGSVLINNNPLAKLSEITEGDKITLYKNSYIRIRRKERSTGGQWMYYPDFETAAERDGQKSGAECYTMSYNHYLEIISNTSQDNLQEDSNNTLGANSNNKSTIYSYVNDDEVKLSYKEKRIALVIGNSDYQDYSWQDVPTCRQSAFSVAEKLRSIGFHTIVISNANQDKFFDVLHDFIKREVKDSLMIKLFYYVGHGMRIDGYDYVVPIDAGKNDAKRSIKNDTIAQMLIQSKNADYNFLFFDACRDTLFSPLKNVYNNDRIGDHTCIIFSTQENDYATEKKSDKDISTPFSSAFIKSIGSPNTQVDNMLKKLSNKVYRETGKKIEWKPSNLQEFKVRFNREIPMFWLDVSGTVQIPFETDLPISFTSNLCFVVNNIYLWRCKTQFEIELAANILKYHRTPPVFLYDGSNIKHASEFRNVQNLSCRYGPSFDICRDWSFTPMVGFSYHYLKGTKVNEMKAEPVSTYCCNVTFDSELSYKFSKRLKLNIFLGTNVWQINNENYNTLNKDVSFMNDWYSPLKSINTGVGLSYRLGK